MCLYVFAKKLSACASVVVQQASCKVLAGRFVDHVGRTCQLCNQVFIQVSLPDREKPKELGTRLVEERLQHARIAKTLKLVQLRQN